MGLNIVCSVRELARNMYASGKPATGHFDRPCWFSYVFKKTLKLFNV
jgi:hypothetical protein